MARIQSRQDLIEVAFKTTMYWRMAYGLGRIYLGYLLLRLIGHPVLDAYQHLVHPAGENARDRFLISMGHLISHHSHTITYFMAAYLFFWGFVDIILSIAMIRHILWTFALSIALIILFVIYELYRYAHTHSPILLGLVIIDLFIAYMIGLEHRKLKTRRLALVK